MLDFCYVSSYFACIRSTIHKSASSVRTCLCYILGSILLIRNKGKVHKFVRRCKTAMTSLCVYFKLMTLYPDHFLHNLFLSKMMYTCINGDAWCSFRTEMTSILLICILIFQFYPFDAVCFPNRFSAFDLTPFPNSAFVPLIARSVRNYVW